MMLSRYKNLTLEFQGAQEPLVENISERFLVLSKVVLDIHERKKKKRV